MTQMHAQKMTIRLQVLEPQMLWDVFLDFLERVVSQSNKQEFLTGPLDKLRAPITEPF